MFYKKEFEGIKKELKSVKALNGVIIKQIKELSKVVTTLVLKHNEVIKLTTHEEEDLDLTLYNDDPELQDYIKYWVDKGLSVADAVKKFYNSGEKL